MTAREYLQTAITAREFYDEQKKKAQRIREKIESPARAYYGVGVQHSANPDKMADNIAELIKATEAQTAACLSFLEISRRIAAQLCEIPDNLQFIILFEKYVMGKTPAEIAGQWGKDLRYIYKDHCRALRVFAQIYGLEDE